MSPDRVRELFGRAQTSPDTLSTSVVKHGRIDDLVLDDLRDNCERFQEALTSHPTIEIGEDDAGEKLTREYDLAPPLYQDLFHAHYTSGDSVKVRPAGEVRSSHEMNRRIMESYIHHDKFSKTRPHTVSDDLTSMLATMAAQDTIDEALAGDLREHAARATEMAEREDKISSIEDELKEMVERAAGGEPTPQDGEAMADAQGQLADAHQELADLIGQNESSNMGLQVAEAVDKAVDEANKTVKAWSSIPGSLVGDKKTMSAEKALALASAWKSNKQLARVAELVGRFERDFRFQRSNRITGGRDEIVDVELGNDLDLVLPTEMMQFMHPLLKLKFLKQYTERSLLQFEMVGQSEAGRGPFIAAIDRSASMGFDRTTFANAVTLAMLSIARREKREFASIDFHVNAFPPVMFPSRGAINTNAVTALACSGGSGGGTNITTALLAAKEVIDKAPAFKTADVIVITDGEDRWQEDDIKLAEGFAARGVRIHSMVIGAPRTHYTDEAARITGGTAVAITDLMAPSGATSQLAGAIS